MKYNSKYQSDKYNRQTKSSLYIPKDYDIAFTVPIYLKIFYFENECFIITVTNPGVVSKYKTYAYDASVEHFKDKKDIIAIAKGRYNLAGGSSIHYSSMWTMKFTQPELVCDVKKMKSISHKILKKYYDKAIDEVEYTKILLTMDKIDD